MSASYTGPSRSASQDRPTAFPGRTIYVSVLTGYSSFSLTTNNGVITGFGLSFNSSVTGYGGAGSRLQTYNYNVYLDGTNVYSASSGGPSLSYTYTGGVLSNAKHTIRITASASGDDNTNSGQFFVDVNIDDSYDFLASGLLNTINFVNTSTGNTRYVLLPFPDIYSGQLLFFKDSGANANNRNIILAPPNGGFTIDDSTSLTISNRAGCVTLFSDSFIWRVANYYTSNNQPTLSTASTGSFADGKQATAVIGRINVFDVDSNSARQSGDNSVILPSPSAGELCMVLYIGKLSSKGSGNSLLFQVTGGSSIDNIYNNTNNQAYISTNTSNKSTGVVFISDGNNWYVAGYYPGANWAWETSTAVGNTSVNLGTNLLNVTPFISGKDYYLPPSTIGAILNIQKNISGMNTSGAIFHPNGTGFFNKDIQRIYYNGNPSNSSTWFVNYGGNSYPIIAYTPN
jgi:hypothetical protein